MPSRSSQVDQDGQDSSLGSDRDREPWWARFADQAIKQGPLFAVVVLAIGTYVWKLSPELEAAETKRSEAFNSALKTLGDRFEASQAAAVSQIKAQHDKLADGLSSTREKISELVGEIRAARLTDHARRVSDAKPSSGGN